MIAGSRRASSIVTDTLTSEVVTTSTGVLWRSNTSNSRRRKPCAISMRVEVMSTTVTRLLRRDRRQRPVRLAAARAVISVPRACGAMRIEDPHRNVARHRRLNGRRMQHLRAEVGQLRGFGERQMRHDLRVLDDARIGGEHAVDVGPDLDLRRAEAGADDGRRKIRAAAAERRGHAVGGGADEAADHRNAPGRQRRIGVRHQRRGRLLEQRRRRRVFAVGHHRLPRIDPAWRAARARSAPPRRSGC